MGGLDPQIVWGGGALLAALAVIALVAALGARKRVPEAAKPAGRSASALAPRTPARSPTPLRPAPTPAAAEPGLQTDPQPEPQPEPQPQAWSPPLRAPALNHNADFDDYPEETGPPPHWASWTKPRMKRAARAEGGHAVSVPGLEGALGCGIEQKTGAGFPALAPGDYVLEAEFALESGSLEGAGLLLMLFSDPELQKSTAVEKAALSEAVGADGSMAGAGAAGATYRLSRPVTIAGETPVYGRLVAAAHHSFFGATDAANSIAFTRVALRAA